VLRWHYCGRYLEHGWWEGEKRGRKYLQLSIYIRTRIDIRVSSFESSLASSSLRASFPPKAASGSISRSSERSGLSCSLSLRSSMPRVESARPRLQRCGDTDRKPNHDQFPFRSLLRLQVGTRISSDSALYAIGMSINSAYHHVLSPVLRDWIHTGYNSEDTEIHSTPVGILACQREPLLRHLDATVVSSALSSPPPPPKGKNTKKAVLAPTIPQDAICLEVCLNDTVIFPEGGGQPSDTGIITTTEGIFTSITCP
jgi:hypothetical protein